MKRPRLPSDEERAEWKAETKRDKKFREEREAREAEIIAAPAAPEKRPRKPEPVVIPPSPARPKKSSLAPLAVGDLTPTDGNTARRLKRGELPIEATLDLHGLTRKEAFTTLMRRLPQWVNRGARCVCIITGKGTRGEGILRAELPRWLNEPAARAHIVAFCTAPQKWGGAGAVLVLLKRMR